jgi:hypothetical protein
MQITKLHWRTLRAKTLQKLGIKHEPLIGEHYARRILKALEKLKTTPEEKEKIIQIVTRALERTMQKDRAHSLASFNSDAGIRQQQEKIRETIGKKRAGKFFAMINDPYF